MSRRKPRLIEPSKPSTRLPFVEAARNAKGQTYLYYRKDGRRIALPRPEGGAEFLRAYYAAQAEFEEAKPEAASVAAVVSAYLDDPDFRQLAPASQREYRRVLDIFVESFGTLPIAAFNEARIAKVRKADEESPANWNSLRSRMIVAVDHWRAQHPGALPANHWRTSKRLRLEASDANRPWPPGVLLAVMRAATPEFRALLTGYLLTVQRGSDVTRLSPDQYDPETQTLAVRQVKTGEAIRLHVPDSLARVIVAMRGRRPDRLFVTPRGMRWTVGNAQETLARLLAQLGLPRHTLHGLRSTGPVALKLLGFENRAIRALTGHTSDANLETYLRGVDHYVLARPAQDALEAQFADVLTGAEEGANTRKFAGVTGRAARKGKAP